MAVCAIEGFWLPLTVETAGLTEAEGRDARNRLDADQIRRHLSRPPSSTCRTRSTWMAVMALIFWPFQSPHPASARRQEAFPHRRLHRHGQTLRVRPKMVRPAGPETAGPQADPRRMRENYGFFSISAPSERARREPGSASTRSPRDHHRCSSLRSRQFCFP
jgi:hypothetical protein